MKIKFGIFSIGLAAVLAFSGIAAAPAIARIDDYGTVHLVRTQKNLRNQISIRGNSGGSIGKYALQAARLRGKGTLVKFSGRCDSACTLFLGLPQKQICISKGAFFRFHAPTHQSRRAASVARNYMMKKYPRWVRNWISSKRGLTRNLITMDYKYASRYIQTCNA